MAITGTDVPQNQRRPVTYIADVRPAWPTISVQET